MPTITQESITQAVNDSKTKHGKVVLADIERDLNISRGRARTLQKNGFILKANGNKGKGRVKKLDGFEEIIKERFLKEGIKNSDVIYQQIKEAGFTGKKTIVKAFILRNKDIIPDRKRAEERPDRARRYETAEGEMFQIDWGFINISDPVSGDRQCACFAMICHHCGKRYVEFFPSARQENLFRGIIHGFMALGVPRFIYTDNMKSIVIRRDSDGKPIWNHDYDLFQKAAGFETRLAKIAHPWTKGAAERLVRYVKDNFIQGRKFRNISDMNDQVAIWCGEKNLDENTSRGAIPEKEHAKERLKPFVLTDSIKEYLYPLRRITWDGFISIEGRQFGVPYSFSGKTVRAGREGDCLTLHNPLTYEVIYSHRIDWSKKPKAAIGQWAVEEKPTAPVTATAKLTDPAGSQPDRRLSRFSILEAEDYDKR